MVGIHPKITKWTRDFLTGRTYQIRIEGALSSVFNACTGVPQGDVLSLPVELRYTHELSDTIDGLG